MRGRPNCSRPQLCPQPAGGTNAYILSRSRRTEPLTRQIFPKTFLKNSAELEADSSPREADRIGSQPVDSFTGVGKLTLPGKHPPCSNQRGSIRHGVFHPHFKPAYTYAYTYIVISQAHRRSKSHTTADSFTAANNVIGPAEQRYASCAPQIEDRTLPYLQDVGRDMCIAEK